MKQFLKQIAATTSALALLLALAPTQSASAAFPGLNGRIVFQSLRDGADNEIYSMKRDGSDVRQLTSNTNIDVQASYSPNGTKIVFWTDRDGNREIYTMDPDGLNQTRITNNSAIDQQPSWSADGSKILFTSNRNGGVLGVFIMNSDGTNVVALTQDEPATASSTAVISPQSNKIIYKRGGSLASMNIDGTNKTSLTSGSNPDWSPNGTKVAFNHAPAGNDNVFTMNELGGDVTALTSDTAADTDPKWLPDGTQIVFTASRDGNSEIYLMKSDGTNQTRITNNLVSDGAPAIQPLTIPPATIDPSITLNATQGPVIFDAPANHTDTYESIDSTSVTITAQPQKGSVAVDPATGEITYTPSRQARTTSILTALDDLLFTPASAQSSNQDSFTYQICSTANAQLCTQSTVTVDLAAAAASLAATGGNVVNLVLLGTLISGVAIAARSLRRKLYV